MGGGAESSSSLTQDGGDYWATVFWVLDLNIGALLHCGRTDVMEVCGRDGASSRRRWAF